MQNNLYYRTQLEHRVTLLPKYMDGNIDKHLLESLKVNVEEKPFESGIIIRVYNIVDYCDGIIDKTDFLANSVHRVKFECLVCSPTEGMEVICKIQNFVRGYIFCINGNLKIAVSYSDIQNDDRFYQKNGKIFNKTNNIELKKGDFVKVLLFKFTVQGPDKYILATAKLLNVASSDDIISYKNDKKLRAPDNMDIDEEYI